MHGILINPFLQTVEAVEIQSGLQAIYAALSGLTCPRFDDAGLMVQHHIEAHSFDIVGLGTDRSGNSVDMFVDDEGLLVSAEVQQCYFRLAGNLDRLPFAGRALILGGTGNGDTVSTALDVKDVERLLVWVPIGEHFDAPAPVITSFATFDEMVEQLAGRGAK